MEGTTFWIAAALAAVCVGMGKGGLPVISGMGVPILALFMPAGAAAGILLPVYIASDAISLWAYWRNFHRKVLLIMLAALPVGTGIGWMTAHLVSEAAVTLLVGLIGAVYAARAILQRKVDAPPRPARVAPGLFWGTISGFTSFVSHSGGPPFQVYALPLGMPKLMFAGTVAVAFAYINVIKLIPYYFLGQLSFENLKVSLTLFAPGIAGVLIGLKLVRILPEKLFFRMIVWALLILSLRLIWKGATAL